MKHRTEGHTETTHLRRHARRLVGSLRTGAQPSGRLRLARLACSRAKCWTACCASASCIPSRSSGTRAARSSRERTTGISMSPAGTSGRRTRPGSARPARTPPSGTRPRRNSSWADRTRRKYDHPTQKPVELMRRPILNHTQARRAGLRSVPGQRHHPGRRGTDRARLPGHRAGPEVRRRHLHQVLQPHGQASCAGRRRLQGRDLRARERRPAARVAGPDWTGGVRSKKARRGRSRAGGKGGRLDATWRCCTRGCRLRAFRISP